MLLCIVPFSASYLLASTGIKTQDETEQYKNNNNNKFIFVVVHDYYFT